VGRGVEKRQSGLRNIEIGCSGRKRGKLVKTGKCG